MIYDSVWFMNCWKWSMLLASGTIIMTQKELTLKCMELVRLLTKWQIMGDYVYVSLQRRQTEFIRLWTTQSVYYYWFNSNMQQNSRTIEQNQSLECNENKQVSINHENKSTSKRFSLEHWDSNQSKRSISKNLSQVTLSLKTRAYIGKNMTGAFWEPKKVNRRK
jgi:hypothetical protein